MIDQENQGKNTNYLAIGKEIEAIKEKQDYLRRPNGTIDSLWADMKTKVGWQLFIWIVAAFFAFTSIMQLLMYRSLDDTNRKIARLDDLVINIIRGKK